MKTLKKKHRGMLNEILDDHDLMKHISDKCVWKYDNSFTLVTYINEILEEDQYDGIDIDWLNDIREAFIKYNKMKVGTKNNSTTPKKKNTNKPLIIKDCKDCKHKTTTTRTSMICTVCKASTNKSEFESKLSCDTCVHYKSFTGGQTCTHMVVCFNHSEYKHISNPSCSTCTYLVVNQSCKHAMTCKSYSKYKL